MTGIQAVILGVVQGITEFLPVSSSGHLVVLAKIWHVSEGGLIFVTFLHLGTLLAVIWAFKKECVWLIRHPKAWVNRMILAALIPTVFIGAIFEELFENLFSSAITVGFEFVITGIILWWMDSRTSHQGKSEEDMNAVDALWVGTLQGVAILPALSRSGLTIAAGLWRGMDRTAAGRFSFLLAIPSILGATLVELDDLWESPALLHHILWTPVFLGTVAAAVAGYVSVKGTLWLLKTARMRFFAVYVWGLAAFILWDQMTAHRWFPPLH